MIQFWCYVQCSLENRWSGWALEGQLLILAGLFGRFRRGETLPDLLCSPLCLRSASLWTNSLGSVWRGTWFLSNRSVSCLGEKTRRSRSFCWLFLMLDWCSPPCRSYDLYRSPTRHSFTHECWAGTQLKYFFLNFLTLGSSNYHFHQCRMEVWARELHIQTLAEEDSWKWEFRHLSWLLLRIFSVIFHPLC